MSHTFARPLAERVTRWLTALLLTAAFLTAAYALTTTVPASWWPATGQAFATPAPAPTPRADRVEACALIVGPAHDLCLQATPGKTGARISRTRAWTLLGAAAALAGTAAWRRRRTR